MQLRAKALDIPVRVIHNASIMNAVGTCGLQLYRYGEVGLTITRVQKLQAMLVESALPALACRMQILSTACKKGTMETVEAFALQAVSIVFFTDSWRPDSFYPRILANRQRGLHTLCLLDIKVKEPSLESLARGRKVPMPILHFASLHAP